MDTKTPCKSIAILTGAGISVPSGISAFHNAGSKWNFSHIEDIASKLGFFENRALFYAFYNNMMRPEFQKAIPNSAHMAITELQRHYPANVIILTENIDNLHEQAGTNNVHHLRGRLDESVCHWCKHIISNSGETDENTICPNCKSRGCMRPNIVFAGESIFVEGVSRALKSDLFIAVGTSGTVLPSSSFADVAKNQGAHTIEINPAPAKNADSFDEHIYGDLTKTLPEFVAKLISSIR